METLQHWLIGDTENQLDVLETCSGSGKHVSENAGTTAPQNRILSIPQNILC